ncbi:5-oxoprolinase subunit PxpB [Microbulbifer bruguierae]|uniref:5-oxoprolinase subunit PxpB n=1 Tax=Microbulbifer bruguierae TaxID=3029061 RepID=A0ABY8NIH4_9GAMM|nr:5-oxoprolinase subunit PxpB [Microbulbifer bruguierae]WGL18244.1 5-oxoprolinase subunit PxpB [Microbulbifer bruguierae]
MTPPYFLRDNGDTALDICFSAEPSEDLSKLIIGLEAFLGSAKQREHSPEILEMIPAYQCLTVCYSPLFGQQQAQPSAATIHDKLQRAVGEFLEERQVDPTPYSQRASELVRIPVCYEDTFAPDMAQVCEYTGLDRQTVIERHTSRSYLVHMLGFTPGFLYLGGLDESIACPRKATPSLRVAAGSVGIGGQQTGIYPQSTPGGWQIIGRTPLKLFQPEKTFPFIAHPLDRVQFFAISAHEFLILEQNQENTTSDQTRGPA